jgi:2-iminobutanoate/2-iminopropanoate deaminase
MLRLSSNLLFFIALAFMVACQSQSSPADASASEESPVENMNAAKKVIKTDQAPNPVGPYSQAIIAGNTLYLAGQIAINPESGDMVTDNIENEARQVMDNLQAVLEEAGMSMDNVVKTTIYMTDLNNFGKVNEIYGSYFGEMPPARVTVGVAALPKGANLEITMEAVR